MELTLEAQTQAFIYSCVLGVILAVIYTAIGIIKIILKYFMVIMKNI